MSYNESFETGKKIKITDSLKYQNPLGLISYQACCSWQVLEDKLAGTAMMRMWEGKVGQAHIPLEMEICN